MYTYVYYDLNMLHAHAMYICSLLILTFVSLYMCSIAHLDSSMEVLDLPVCGSSLMPYCHFELEPSDYLSQRASGDVTRGGGTFATSGASVDPASTRVIEFSSCGVGIKNIKYVILVPLTCLLYTSDAADE